MKKIIISLLIILSSLSSINLKEEFERGNYQNAIELSTKVIVENPNDLQALQIRAKSYKALGEFKKANLDFKKLLQIDSDLEYGIEFILERGMFLKESGDTTFVNLYKNGLEKYSNSLELLNQLSEYYISAKDYSNSIVYLNKIYNIDNSLSTMVKIAKYNFKGKNYTEAALNYSTILERSKRTASLIYNRGLAYYYGKDIKQAYNDFKEVVAIDPNYDKALNKLGEIDFTEKRYDESISHYSRSIEVNPNNYETYYKRSKAYIYKKQLKEAALDLTHYLELGKDRVKNRKEIENLIDQLNS